MRSHRSEGHSQLVAGAAILLLAIFAVAVGMRSFHQSKHLDELREAWAANYATFDRITAMKADLSTAEQALAELDGSWRFPLKTSSWIQTCVDRAPADFEIGKIHIESTLVYDPAGQIDAEKGIPFRQYQAEIAARYYAENAQSGILDYREQLHRSDAIHTVFERVELEGLKQIEAREGTSLRAHTVFSVRMTGTPHPMKLGTPSP